MNERHNIWGIIYVLSKKYTTPEFRILEYTKFTRNLPYEWTKGF